MTPEQAEEEALRRVGLVTLILTQAVTMIAVSLLTPPAVGFGYGLGAGWLIGVTIANLRQGPAR